MDRVPDVLVAEVTRAFESTKEEDGRCGSKTKNDAEQGGFIHNIVFSKFLLLYLVEFVVDIQISEKSTLIKWTANGIQDEDGYNQQCKYIIGESVSAKSAWQELVKCALEGKMISTDIITHRVANSMNRVRSKKAHNVHIPQAQMDTHP